MAAAPTAAARAEKAVPPLPQQVALFEGLATQAAPEDPLRALANPAGPALLEGRRWGAAVTVRDGQGPGGAPIFVHGAGWAEGADGEGWAVWVAHGGRDALPGSPSESVTELSLGYAYAVTMGPRWALGVAGHYRRVRGQPTGPETPWEDHYLGVDVGVLASPSDRVVLSGRLDSMLEVRQVGPGGPAERAAARPPQLGAGIAFEANRYLVLEADGVDLLDAGTGRAVRLEARLYPAAPLALRLGYERSERGDGFMVGAGAEAPGRRWAVSYAFLAGPAYGGIHQLGLIVAVP